MRRTLFISLAVLAVLGLLGYTAHKVNLLGIIMNMHTPPEH